MAYGSALPSRIRLKRERASVHESSHLVAGSRSLGSASDGKPRCLLDVHWEARRLRRDWQTREVQLALVSGRGRLDRVAAPARLAEPAPGVAATC
jgi:hypothetical protein